VVLRGKMKGVYLVCLKGTTTRLGRAFASRDVSEQAHVMTARIASSRPQPISSNSAGWLGALPLPRLHGSTMPLCWAGEALQPDRSTQYLDMYHSRGSAASG
jgi:hypothetical protein